MFYSNYDEQEWRNASEAAEREERRREAQEMFDWHAGSSPEYVAWIEEGGTYEPRPRRIDAQRESNTRNEEVA